jgi:hypothetical protein
MKGHEINTNIKSNIFNNENCVIHLISCHDDDINPSFISNHITKKYPSLWTMMKKGDLVEVVNMSGYRSDGRYYVDEYKRKKTNNLSINSLYYGYDDYGSIPKHFSTISNFPIGYFNEENIITNNTFVPNTTKSSYWHSNHHPMFIDTKSLKLDTVKYDDIFVDYILDDEKENYVFAYVILKFRQKDYCFLIYKVIKEKVQNDNIIKELIKKLINIFKNKPMIVEMENIDEIFDENNSMINKIKKEHNIDNKNIIIVM